MVVDTNTRIVERCEHVRGTLVAWGNRRYQDHDETSAENVPGCAEDAEYAHKLDCTGTGHLQIVCIVTVI